MVDLSQRPDTGIGYYWTAIADIRYVAGVNSLAAAGYRVGLLIGQVEKPNRAVVLWWLVSRQFQYGAVAGPGDWTNKIDQQVPTSALDDAAVGVSLVSRSRGA